MDIKYNKEINENLSMGEYSLLYYEDILEKNVFNKLILSTILRLHKKKYVELDNNENNQLIIKTKKGTAKLKISETFIYECLKFIDTNKDNILTLNELNSIKNNVFAKYKNNIKELVIQEAISDDLIDTEKYKNKRKHFFRALEILLIIIFSFLGAYGLISLMILLLFIYNIKFTNYSKDTISKLKNELLKEELMKYSSKKEIQNIIIEFIVFIFIYYFISYFLSSIFSGVLFMLVPIIGLGIAILEFIKYNKSDLFTDKAILNKNNLKGLENYLKDYSLIKDKKALEIHLWEDYLALSVLLGINNNVTEEIRLNLTELKQKRTLQFDYYANKYFYINEKGEKVFKE